jgi:hypothetical protein
MENIVQLVKNGIAHFQNATNDNWTLREANFFKETMNDLSFLVQRIQQFHQKSQTSVRNFNAHLLEIFRLNIESLLLNMEAFVISSSSLQNLRGNGSIALYPEELIYSIKVVIEQSFKAVHSAWITFLQSSTHQTDGYSSNIQTRPPNNPVPKDHPVSKNQPPNYTVTKPQPPIHPVPKRQPPIHPVLKSKPPDHHNTQPPVNPVPNKKPPDNPVLQTQPTNNPGPPKQPQNNPGSKNQPPSNPGPKTQPQNNPGSKNQPPNNPGAPKQPPSNPGPKIQPPNNPGPQKQPQNHPEPKTQQSDHPMPKTQPPNHLETKAQSPGRLELKTQSPNNPGPKTPPDISVRKEQGKVDHPAQHSAEKMSPNSSPCGTPKQNQHRFVLKECYVSLEKIDGRFFTLRSGTIESINCTAMSEKDTPHKKQRSKIIAATGNNDLSSGKNEGNVPRESHIKSLCKTRTTKAKEHRQKTPLHTGEKCRHTKGNFIPSMRLPALSPNHGIPVKISPRKISHNSKKFSFSEGSALILSNSKETQTHFKTKSSIHASNYYKKFGKQHQNTGNENQSMENQHQNMGNQHQNTGNQHQNTGNQHKNKGSQDKNVGNPSQNTGNQHQNTGNEHQNRENEHKTAGHGKQDIGDKNQTTGHEHQTTEHEHQTTEHERQTTEHEHQITGHEHQTTEHEHQTRGNEHQTTGYEHKTRGNEKQHIENVDQNTENGHQNTENGQQTGGNEKYQTIENEKHQYTENENKNKDPRRHYDKLDRTSKAVDKERRDCDSILPQLSMKNKKRHGRETLLCGVNHSTNMPSKEDYSITTKDHCIVSFVSSIKSYKNNSSSVHVSLQVCCVKRNVLAKKLRAEEAIKQSQSSRDHQSRPRALDVPRTVTSSTYHSRKRSSGEEMCSLIPKKCIKIEPDAVKVENSNKYSQHDQSKMSQKDQNNNIEVKEQNKSISVPVKSSKCQHELDRRLSSKCESRDDVVNKDDCGKTLRLLEDESIFFLNRQAALTARIKSKKKQKASIVTAST